VKLLKELHAQIWTVCGTLLVLYTLTGQTLRMATYTFLASFGLHLIGALVMNEGEEE